MATLSHIFARGISGTLDAESFDSAANIVAWHLRRIFGELALPLELRKAARLDSWLLAYCREKGLAGVPTRTIQQFGPHGLRERPAIEAAARELDDVGRARLIQDGRRREIGVSPALLGVSAT